MSLSFKIQRNPSTLSRSSNHPDRRSKPPSNRLGHDSDSSDDDDRPRSRRAGSIELIRDFDSTRFVASPPSLLRCSSSVSLRLPRPKKNKKVLVKSLPGAVLRLNLNQCRSPFARLLSPSVSPHSAPPRPEASSGPRAIPALPDRDFRAVHLARKNKRAKKALYKPETLGGSDRQPARDNENREGVDRMNSTAIVGGLKTAGPARRLDFPDELAADERDVAAGTGMSTPMEGLQVDEVPAPAAQLAPETAEQRALRELLSQANDADGPPEPLAAIPMPARAMSEDERSGSSESGDETAQFRRDVAGRPDASSLEDYARVPVGQFGLALLKGMGWTEGASTSRRGRKGLVEAYVPQARPSLLGIGAKPLVLDTDAPSANGATNKGKGKKPDRKYTPLLRKVIDQGGAARPRSRSPSSRHSSAPSGRDRSPSHSDRHRRDRSPSHSDRHRRDQSPSHSDRHRRDQSPSHSDRHRRDGSSTSYHGRHGDAQRRHAKAQAHRRDTDSGDGQVTSRSSQGRKDGEYRDRRRSRSRERRPT